MMTALSVPTHVFMKALSVTAVGSRVTCSPPPVGTDADFLVLVSADRAPRLNAYLTAAGWAEGGSGASVAEGGLDGNFTSYVRGSVNLIVTTSEEFRRRFLTATAMAKRLNVLAKPDRIALFQAILYGNVSLQDSVA